MAANETRSWSTRRDRDDANTVLDCVGVGFGPSNMALAVALEERGRLDCCLFLEAADTFAWHPGMMIEGTDIQHNPLRDLVTPRNPRSPYGFLTYLEECGRMFEFLNLAAHYPPRSEYAGYVAWAGRKLAHAVRLGSPVEAIDYEMFDGEPVVRVETAGGGVHRGRSLSFGTGRSPLVPDLFHPWLSDDVVHLSDYLFAKERWLERLERPRIAVIGASQSAVEIVLDLADEADVLTVSRGFGFKQKDLSPFTEEIYYPGFVDYFHGADETAQNAITRDLWRSNYGAADIDVLEALNVKLYERTVRQRGGLDIAHNMSVVSLNRRGSGGYDLHLLERHTGERRSEAVDGIVLATGFRNFGAGEGQEPYHPLLANLAEWAVFRADGGIAIDRDYVMHTSRESHLDVPVFINGLCESSHGFGDAGSFSLLSVRSDRIAQRLETTLDRSRSTMRGRAGIERISGTAERKTERAA